MSGSSRGGGRGESLRRLLLGSQPQPPQEPAAVPSSSPVVPTPVENRPGGRGAFLSRLTTLFPQQGSEPSRDLLGIGDAPATTRVGMGRAKLFGLASGMKKPGEPQGLLLPPQERAAQTTSEVSRGAQRTPVHPVHPRSSSDGSDSPPSKALSRLKMVERPEPDESEVPPVIMTGSSGSPLTVACNYIRLRTEAGKGIFQYDVKFKPEIDSQNMRFFVMKQLVEVIGDTKSFDGSTLYLPTKLREDVTYAKAVMPSDNSVVKVKLTFVKELHMGHSQAIHHYNVLFRRIMNILGMALHGRQFFDPAGAKPIPEHKLEVWPGFVTSIQNFEDGVMLCCDASHRVLRNQTVAELMADLVSLARNTDSWKQEFCNLMIGQVVLTRYNNKVYKVDDIDFDSTPNDTFTLKNGDQISYVDYYKRHYCIDIFDKGQPLLKSKVKAKIKGEEVTRLVDLIPELCYLSGITDAMRADFKVMKSIAQHTRISPGHRQVGLLRFLKNINSNKEVRTLLESWGLTLEDTNIKLPARVLNPEEIFFGYNTSHPGDYQCDWTRGATGNPVLSAVDFGSWFIICTKKDEKIVDEFVSMCMKVTPRIGIELSKPIVWTVQNDSTHNYIQQLQRLKQEKQAQIVVIVLPVARADKYAAVKKMCCIEFPIPSQVILTRTIRAPDKLRSVTLKIVLQMNCKLGGTLWTVKIPTKNTMVVGLDSYHDASQRGHSYGAMVASTNNTLSRWYSKIYKQGVGIELIDGLATSLLASLTKYREVNGALPEQIFIYRDGVGDGQLSVCVDHEVPQLLAACQRIAPNYCPKFLVVVVQKRISTRYFAEAGSDFSNPPPGSVMDHSVTRRDMFDFYLVSQSVRQGTVSPTHYIVVHNSTMMDADKIQRFSYKLTHLYYNWCGTVRVPAPCQYAHKLATLVGESTHKEADERLADKLYYL